MTHLINASRCLAIVLQRTKSCALRWDSNSPISMQSRVASIAKTVLVEASAIEVEESPMFSGFCPPDEDHPHYAIWEKGMLKSLEDLNKIIDRPKKTQKMTADQPVPKKLAVENNPRYLEPRRRALEAEKCLFDKTQKTPSEQSIQSKSSIENDPLYLDWNRRVCEAEERLFQKCNIK